MVSGCLSFRQIRTRKSYKARKHGTFSTTQIPKLHYFRVLLGAFLHWRRYELLFWGCFAASIYSQAKVGYYHGNSDTIRQKYTFTQKPLLSVIVHSRKVKRNRILSKREKSCHASPFPAFLCPEPSLYLSVVRRLGIQQCLCLICTLILSFPYFQSEKGIKNFFEKNRKKWLRLSVWRVDITEEMA